MSDVNLSISQDVVRPIIESKIQAAIVSELSSIEPIVAKIVVQVLNHKVDHEGKPERYGSGQEYLTWLCNDAIRKSVDTAVRNKITSMAKDIEASVAAEISRNKRTIAHQLVSGLCQAAGSCYTMKTSFELNVKKD